MKRNISHPATLRAHRAVRPVSVLLLLLLAVVAFATATTQAAPSASVVQAPRVRGYAVGFFRAGQNPNFNICPTTANIREDLSRIISDGLATDIRLYGQSCRLDEVPGLVEELSGGLGVYAAAYCGANPTSTAAELASLVSGAQSHPATVRAAIVCNEAILGNVQSVDQVIAHINNVRSQISQPVSTGEPWHIWRDYPQLAAAADYLLVHVHPYWEQQCPAAAIAWVESRVQLLRGLYPTKPVIVGETGYPTAGPARGCAAPSVANQEAFLAAWLVRAAVLEIPFFWFALFDEAWKGPPDSPEPHWGTFTETRQPKHTGQSVVGPPDNNRDGRVTVVDALCLARQVAGLPATAACPSPLQQPDVTGDGQATIVDALCVARFIAALPRTAFCPIDPP